MRRVARAALFLAGSALGCSPYAQRGEVLYHEGRFVEAAEVFELTEPRLAASPPATCAEYGLYRGLTFLRLGDLSSARQWLAYAYSVEQRAPGTLAEREKATLDRAWAELEQHSRRQPAPKHGQTRVAQGDPVALPHPAGAPANGRRAIAPQ